MSSQPGPVKSEAFECRVSCLCNASLRAPRSSVTLGPAPRRKGDLGGSLLASLLSAHSYSARMLQGNSSKSSVTLLLWRPQSN